jgi:hypothetical protein
MASNQRESDSVIALVADIVRHRGRTGRAVLLAIGVGFAVALAITPVLVVMILFGPQGAAAVAGLSAALTAGVATRRAITNRRSARKP